MDDQSVTEEPMTKKELLDRMARAYTELEDTLRALSDEQLTRPSPSGWSIKDHLAHLAAWEHGVTELLHRRPRFEAMGIKEALSQGKSEEEINDLIYRKHAGLSLAEVLETFRRTHMQMVEAVESLEDGDLVRPYAAYLPAGETGPQRPVIDWIIGNTYEHYEEHTRWIRDSL